METVKTKVGLAFGCYIPFHMGHLLMVTQAETENDEVILGVCGYDGDRGENFIPFKDRQALMKKRYAHKSNITVSVVDDHKIGLTGTFSKDAWKIWADEFFGNAGYDPYDETKEYTWYTGEASYIEKLNELFPNHKFVKLDRHVINISGTAIRENPKENETYIMEEFKEYLRNKNILEEKNFEEEF